MLRIAQWFSVILFAYGLAGCSWLHWWQRDNTVQYGNGLSHDAEIAHWLNQAERAYYKDRLLKPADDNAYLYYSHVLRKDQHNAHAKTGINNIGKRLRALAKTAHDNGNRKQAQRLLSQAEIIQGSTHPANLKLRATIEQDSAGQRPRSLEKRYQYLLPNH